MPVVLGDNLTLEDSKLSAVYKELYTKLNRAYAWTNTQTSGSNGFLSSYNSKGDFIKFITCSNSNNFYLNYANSTMDGFMCYILNGEIYVNYTYSSGVIDYKLESQQSWKICDIISSSFSSSSNWSITLTAINTSGILYQIYYNKNNNQYNEIQVNQDTTWSDLSAKFGINNGKLYKISSTGLTTPPTLTQIGTDNTWEYIAKYDTDTYTYNPLLWGINDGMIYFLYSGTADSDLFNVQNIKTFCGGGLGFKSNQYGYCYADNNNNIVIKTWSSSYVYNIGKIPNIIKIKGGDYPDGTTYPFLTSDGNAGIIKYNGENSSIFYLDKNIHWTDISAGGYNYGNYNYAGIGSQSSNCVYAVGNGNLYKIYFSRSSSNGSIEYILLDDNTNWKKIFGRVNNLQVFGTNTAYRPSLFAFNSSDEIITKTTVYTVKNPEINDSIYYDENLNFKSYVTNSSYPYISDNILVYQRDINNDSSFIKISGDTKYKTVSVADILNATNPNN